MTEEMPYSELLTPEVSDSEMSDSEPSHSEVRGPEQLTLEKTSDDIDVMDELTKSFEDGMKIFTKHMETVNMELSDIESKLNIIEQEIEVIPTIPIPIPTFTEKEKQNYIRQQEKAIFASPEEEYAWAYQQTKACSKCNEIKRLSEYPGNTSGTDAFDRSGYRLRRPECYDCTKNVAKGKAIAKKIAKDNGIDYYAPEGTTCAICNKLPAKGNGLVFDHCHTTNTFRGYCCNSCNRSMGVLGDNIEGVLRVLNYLNRSENRKFKQTEEGILVIDYLAC